MCLFYIEPHLPCLSPYVFQRKFLEKDVSRRYIKSIPKNEFKYYLGKIRWDEDQRKVMGAVYDGAINYIDYQIGRIINFLKEKNLFDLTLIIITSDHGELLGEHDMIGHHFTLCDYLIRVPLILKFPKDINIKGKVKTLVNTNSLFLTLLRVNNLKEKSDLICIDSLPLKDTNTTNGKCVFSEYLTPFTDMFEKVDPKADVRKFDRKLRAVRNDRYKYIWTSNGEDELYDLYSDPEERINIANAQSEVLKELKMTLERWLKNLKVLEHRQKVWELDKEDEEVIKRLQSLGYL
jgi:arylsulfatase A-like enzyme